MEKSEAAFRTISEAAVLLDTPAHVLRFWESRFPQIKPVKRAGGRRYYRPADVALLAGIRRLLHGEGMTIRGVQKILREQGVRHVASLAEPDAATLDAAFAVVEDGPEAETTAAPSAATVLPGPRHVGSAAVAPPIAAPAAPPQPTVVTAEPAPPPGADVALHLPLAVADHPAPGVAAGPERAAQPDLFAPISPPAAGAPPSAVPSDAAAPAEPATEIWLPAVLRRLSASQLAAPHLGRLPPLHARLLALRTRLAKADDTARS